MQGNEPLLLLEASNSYQRAINHQLLHHRANGGWIFVAVHMQGDEPLLLLEAGNSYQRAIQYQQLRRDQFGAEAPPGFLVSKALTGGVY